MMKQTTLASALIIASLTASGSALACDAMGPAKHMGQLMSVDAANHTFTIRDAQSRSPISFEANADIIAALKDYSGSLMVNYTEKEDGNLNAVGVTF